MRPLPVGGEVKFPGMEIERIQALELEGISRRGRMHWSKDFICGNPTRRC